MCCGNNNNNKIDVAKATFEYKPGNKPKTPLEWVMAAKAVEKEKIKDSIGTSGVQSKNTGDN